MNNGERSRSAAMPPPKGAAGAKGAVCQETAMNGISQYFSTVDTNGPRSPLRLLSDTGFTLEHEHRLCKRMCQYFQLPLPHISEYFVSVDHHRIWRRHLAWSIRDGDYLRNAVTNRFASNMVFMSLLLGTEIGVLFSPSKPADTFRDALRNRDYWDVNFYAGLLLCLSVGLTLSTLVANFTAWATISALSSQNSHIILRSSFGLDAAQLPARLVIASIYSFLAWVVIFLWILLPHFWGILVVMFPVVLIAYIVTMYSSFGRLVIYSRAMQETEIFKEEEANQMSSTRLAEELLKKAQREKKKKAPVPLYYRSQAEISKQLSDLRSQSCVGFESDHASQYVSRILSLSSTNEERIPEQEEDEENGLPQSTKYDQHDGGPLRPRSGIRRGLDENSDLF